MLPNKENIAIRRKRTEIDIPHRDSIVTFLHPIFGPETYTKVQLEIEDYGAQRSTMAEAASLAYASVRFHQDTPELDDLRRRIEINWIRTRNGILYVPNRGAYIDENPQFQNYEPLMKEQTLIHRLEHNDPHVKFVPCEYTTGDMTTREFAQHPLIRALAGEDGAEKLARVADAYQATPHLFGVDSLSKPTIIIPGFQRVKRLNNSFILDGGRNKNARGYGLGVLLRYATVSSGTPPSANQF